MTSTVEIYVYLLDEGVDCWRPILAHRQLEDTYLIVHQKIPEDEEWEFKPGQIVRCKIKTFSGGNTGLVAVEAVDRP
jgi:hypothetical protein